MSRRRDLVVFIFVVAVFVLLAVRYEVQDHRVDRVVQAARVQSYAECTAGSAVIMNLNTLLDFLATDLEEQPPTPRREKLATAYRAAILPQPPGICGEEP